MSSTFFTAAPHWRWLIVAYLFLGGLAGGSYFLATMMDLFGKREDRLLVRLAYLIAFPAVCVCGLLLTADLGRPERFWHMLVQAQTFRPMIKAYSPMSIGSWALLLFSGCAFLSFVAVLAERGWLPWPPLLRLNPPAPLGRLVTAVGAPLGLYLAGYTGLLLGVSVTNRWRRSFGILVVAGATLGGTSPEATRTRAGGPGADVGNHPRGAVQLHAGARMYYGTRIDGAGIGQHAFIGGAAEAETR